MKLVLSFLIISTAIILIKGVANMNKCINVGNFNLSDYSSYISDFSSDKIFEKIGTIDDAIKDAKSIWKETYDKNVKSCDIFYDEENNTWLIQGVLPKNRAGGIPYALIKSNGEVLAVWHDK